VSGPRASPLRARQHPTHGHPVPLALIPKDRSQHLRRVIKGIFRSNTSSMTLENRLRVLNPVLRGWGHFYRHAWRAKHVFAFTDHYVWWTIKRWLHKKHPKTPMRQLYKRYGWRKPRGRSIRWQDGAVRPYPVVDLEVEPYRLAWQKTPLFASTSMESPVRNERRTPGSVRGVRKPAGGKSARPTQPR